MFSGRPIRTGKTVGYYYGTLEHSSLMTKMKGQNTYDDGDVSVTVDHFTTRAFKDPEKFSVCTRMDRSA